MLIKRKLLFSQNAISNALNIPSIQQALAKYGYDQARLNNGLALYNEASRLNEFQKKEYGEQFEATDALHLAKAQAGKRYMKHLKIARVVLKNNRNAGESMQLHGDRKDSLSGWISQAKVFYANALSNDSILANLAEFGLNRESLEPVQAAVLDVEQKYNAQLKEMGEAQQATKDRDTAFDLLQNWVSDFTQIARVALEEQPQYLEMLGIVNPL
jgi:hypothetical protein